MGGRRSATISVLAHETACPGGAKTSSPRWRPAFLAGRRGMGLTQSSSLEALDRREPLTGLQAGCVASQRMHVGGVGALRFASTAATDQQLRILMSRDGEVCFGTVGRTRGELLCARVSPGLRGHSMVGQLVTSQGSARQARQAEGASQLVGTGSRGARHRMGSRCLETTSRRLDIVLCTVLSHVLALSAEENLLARSMIHQRHVGWSESCASPGTRGIPKCRHSMTRGLCRWLAGRPEANMMDILSACCRCCVGFRVGDES